MNKCKKVSNLSIYLEWLIVLQEYFSKHIYYKIQKAFLRFLKRQYGAKGKNNECPAPRFPGFEPQYVAM